MKSSSLFSPVGRVPRSYFWAVGATSLAVFWLGAILLQNAGPADRGVATFGLGLVGLGLWINLVTQVKRWHDIDRSGWAILWNILPGGAAVIFIVCGFYRGTSGPNRYGDDPVPASQPLPARSSTSEGHIANAPMHFGESSHEDAFYEEVARELQQNAILPGVWAKAFAAANGDMDRARALYIKYRVRQLAQAVINQKYEEGSAMTPLTPPEIQRSPRSGAFEFGRTLTLFLLALAAAAGAIFRSFKASQRR